MDGREVHQQDPRRDGLVAGSPRDRLLYDPLEHVALIRDSLQPIVSPGIDSVKT